MADRVFGMSLEVFIGLIYSKIYRKTPYLMVKTMVSCRCSLKQWGNIVFFLKWRLLGGLKNTEPPSLRPAAGKRNLCSDVTGEAAEGKSGDGWLSIPEAEWLENNQPSGKLTLLLKMAIYSEFSWVFPLKMVIFHSYVNVYQSEIQIFQPPQTMDSVLRCHDVRC